MSEEKISDNDSKLYRVIIFEWVTILASLFACIGYLHHEVQCQSARTDKLYEMFVDLVKEGRKS